MRRCLLSSLPAAAGGLVVGVLLSAGIAGAQVRFGLVPPNLGIAGMSQSSLVLFCTDAAGVAKPNSAAGIGNASMPMSGANGARGVHIVCP